MHVCLFVCLPAFLSVLSISVYVLGKRGVTCSFVFVYYIYSVADVIMWGESGISHVTQRVENIVYKGSTNRMYNRVTCWPCRTGLKRPCQPCTTVGDGSAIGANPINCLRLISSGEEGGRGGGMGGNDLSDLRLATLRMDWHLQGHQIRYVIRNMEQ